MANELELGAGLKLTNPAPADAYFTKPQGPDTTVPALPYASVAEACQYVKPEVRYLGMAVAVLVGGQAVRHVWKAGTGNGDLVPDGGADISRILFEGSAQSPQAVVQGQYYYTGSAEYLRTGPSASAESIGGEGWQRVSGGTLELDFLQPIEVPNGEEPTLTAADVGKVFRPQTENDTKLPAAAAGVVGQRIAFAGSVLLKVNPGTTDVIRYRGTAETSSIDVTQLTNYGYLELWCEQVGVWRVIQNSDATPLVFSDIRNAVSAGTYVNNDLQDPQPARSIPGMEFTDADYIYRCLTNNIGGIYWVRISKAGGGGPAAPVRDIYAVADVNLDLRAALTADGHTWAKGDLTAYATPEQQLACAPPAEAGQPAGVLIGTADVQAGDTFDAEDYSGDAWRYTYCRRNDGTLGWTRLPKPA